MTDAELIASNPDVLAGKPTIQGTRLSVEFIRNLLAVGWTDDMILGSYPTLSADGLQAAKDWTAGMIKENDP